MATRMQQRRGTASQWTNADPILNAGEIGFESDTNKIKIGDGINHWEDLVYFVDADSLGGSLEDYIPLSQRDAANGVATLDGDGKLTASQIPTIDEIAQDAIDTALTAGTGITKNYDDAANTLTLSVDTTAIQAKVSGVTDTEIGYLDGVTSSIQTQINAKAPTADPSFTGTVSGVTATHVGLGNVDNTSDANKPVSTATQTALDLKAPLASPALTGAPTAPTATAGTNTTQVATTEFVGTAVANLVDSAPGTLDTLNELAAALGDDASFATTVSTSIGTKIAKEDITAKGAILVGTGAGTYAAQTVGSNGQVLTANSAQADGVEWTTISGYSAPTLGSTSIASGATVTTIAGLTLTAPTLTGTVIASGDINMSAVGGPGSIKDEFILHLMGAF